MLPTQLGRAGQCSHPRGNIRSKLRQKQEGLHGGADLALLLGGLRQQPGLLADGRHHCGIPLAEGLHPAALLARQGRNRRRFLDRLQQVRRPIRLAQIQGAAGQQDPGQVSFRAIGLSPDELLKICNLRIIARPRQDTPSRSQRHAPPPTDRYWRAGTRRH